MNNYLLNKHLDTLLANTLDIALKRRARKIIEYLSPNNKDNILDVGCGDGYYTYLISKLGLKNVNLIGVDSDQKALSSARRNISDNNIKLVKSNIMKGLPFKSNTFDKVVMSEVCEHLPNDVNGLKEVKRVLKKGGTLVLSVPNYNFPLLWDPVNWVLQNIFNTHIQSGFFAGIWNQHKRLYTIDNFRSLLNKTGFVIEEEDVETFWCLPFNHYVINLGARILSKDRNNKLFSGANKFSTSKKQSKLSEIYNYISNTIDSFNNDVSKNNNIGVSIVVKATIR